MSSRNKLENWNIASCLVVVLALLMNLLCLGFVAYRLKLYLTGPVTSNTTTHSKVCIKCQGTLNSDEATVTYNNVTGKCCTQTIEGVTYLINMGLLQRDQAIEKLKMFSTTSGHFQLIPGNDSLLKLRQDKQERHSRSPEVDTNGFLYIKDNGSYFVYSSVYFRAKDSNRCPLEQRTWTLAVKRKIGNNSDETMMEASHTCCDNDYCIRERATAYTADVFNLTAGDVIHVHVTERDLVYFDERSSYFGLMMLNGGTVF